MQKYIMPVLITAILTATLTFTLTTTFNKHERIKFCQYAQKFAAKQNDIMVSQKNAVDNLEVVECDGTARIIRDDKNEVQNFTLFFPENKYEVSITQVAKITNVTFLAKKIK